MKRLLLSLLAIVVIASPAFAQDTLRLMTYNLLRYGSNNQFCNVSCKDQQLERIIERTNPDVFCIQEMINNPVYANRIQDLLNQDGTTDRYERASVSELSSGSITNMLFYDNNKLSLKDTEVLNTSPRSTQIYTLYYNDPNLASGDTTFFRVVAVHLKAGQSSSDEQKRTSQVNTIMDVFEDEPTLTNAFVMGDFNIYESTEPAYGAMTNPTSSIIGFNDPIKRAGDWHDNSSFADIHTQSTRTDQESDGGSSGGSDDRFDFILISDMVEAGTNGISYVDESYTTYGQDGSFFNGTVTSTSAVPSVVAAALYNLSDHLPVFADFAFSDVTAVHRSEERALAGARLLGNPVQAQLRIAAELPSAEPLTFTVLDYTGRQLQSESQTATDGRYQLDVADLPAGLYILRMRSANGANHSLRFIKS